jgi:hypothetical protein
LQFIEIIDRVWHGQHVDPVGERVGIDQLR